MKNKINLGCGLDYKQDWVNVDADKSLKADMHFDLRKKFPLEDSSFNYVLAQDVIEHFSKEDGKSFLDECWRILKPGGKIETRIPNIFQIFRQFKKDPEVLIKFIHGDTSQDSDLGAHKYAYTTETLGKTLSLAGFRVEKISKETTNIVCIAKKIKKDSKKLNILISLQDSGGLGGTETFFLALAKSLRRKKTNVSFTSWNGSLVTKEIKKLGLPNFKTPIRMDLVGDYKGFLKFFFFLPYALYFNFENLLKYKRSGGKLVLMPGFSDKVLLSPIARLLGLKVVWVEFAPLKSIFSREFNIPKVLYRLIKNIPAKVIVPGTNTKRKLIPETRISEARIETIPCGLELKKRIFAEKRKELVIGNVSRIEDGKGQDLLVKAFAIVKKKFPSAKLVIAGAGNISDLKGLAKREGIYKDVLFPGYVDDALKTISGFDLFVFPSHWNLEGFGLVPLEAMMMGVPVVASDFGPIPEVVGDAAILVQPEKEKLAKAIIKVLGDKSLRSRLISKGARRVKEFGIDKIADRYLKSLGSI